MALPTGDDERTIIWKLVLQAKEATDNLTIFQKQAQELKDFLKTVNEQGGASFDTISRSLKAALQKDVSDAKKNLQELNAVLKDLQKSANLKLDLATKKPLDPSQLAQVNQAIKAQKQKIIEARAELSKATEAMRVYQQVNTSALQAVKREADLAAQGIGGLTQAVTVSSSETQNSYAQMVSSTQSFGTTVDELKAKLISIRQTTGEGFAQIATNLGVVLQTNVRQSTEEVRRLEEEIRKLQTTSQTTAPAIDTAQIDTQALQNLQQQLDVAKQKAQEAEKSLVNFSKNINPALQQLGVTATTTSQGIATLSSVAGQSAQDVIAAFQQSDASVQSFGALVNGLKQRMVEIQQQTGESFKTISSVMRQTFRADSKQSIEDFKQQIRSANEELKTLQRTIANPPVGTGQDQLSIMRNRVAELRNTLPTLQKQLADTQRNAKLVDTAMAQAGSSLGKATVEAKLFGFALNDLNSISRIFFGTTLAQLAIRVLQSLGNWLGDAADKALRFSKSVFQLEVGVRALRRSGIDITTESIIGNLQRINEEVGNLYSNLQLIEGAAQFTNLIRDLGLTANEIFTLQEAVVKLAVVNGRSMEDVQRTVALALSSGYTEGLQRLGVSINRLTIAEEANRIGFKGGYTALSEQARAQATYNLLIQKTTKYADDLTEAQRKLFGELQGTEAQIENIQVAVGERWLPVQLLLNKALLVFLELLNKIPIVASLTALSTMSTAFKALPAVWENSSRKADGFIDRLKVVLDFLKQINDARKEFQPLEPIIADFAGFDDIGLGEEEFSDSQDKLMSALEDFGSDVADLDEETAEKRRKIEQDLQEDLARITRKGVEDRLDIERDYQNDLDKLDREAAERRAKLARDLQQKLKDIDIKLEFSIEEAELKFDFDVQSTIIKFNEDVAKANESFRQKEVDRERKYNEELIRIREDYLMTLEDALEVRDARAVLHARRQFILEKNRAERENEINKEKNTEGLQEDLRDAAQRRDARLRELQFELEQRRAELERQAQFDREAAQRNYDEDLKDLQRKLENEKYERFLARLEEERDQADKEKRDKLFRMLKYDNELKELQKFYDDKIKLLGDHLAQQAELMKLGSDEVLKVIELYFGEGGLALSIFKAYLASVEALIQGMSKINVTGFGPEEKTSSSSGGNNDMDNFPFASGGALVARKPVQATFGEVPEVAIFSPLSEIHKLPDLLGGLGVGTDNKAGSMTLRVALAEGLVADIVDQSMDNVAEVIFERSRAREIT